MSANAATVTTARLTPELFVPTGARLASRSVLIVALSLIIVVGFGFRATQLGTDSLSEDEFNKLKAVEDYRAHGLTSANGEHPLLMKALLTVSVVACERWNQTSVVASYPSLNVSTESALRIPGVIVGSLTSLLIFLVVSELFGTEVGLIAAVLWAVDPTGISFSRIAKEDSFMLFFFLLANVFWLRGQRVAESGEGRPEPYYWATAASFGAMIASKYLPHLMAISGSYYYIFQGIKSTRWRMGKRKWLIFFAVLGVVFLVCNLTILLPGTWQEMKVFAGEKRIGHDSYEFMGTLYRNQLSLWLKGSPWYFYYVLMGIKLPLPVLVGFIAGFPLLFRKRTGDGRYFLLFWFFYWFVPFSFIGGKFTRYFTMGLPVVLITSAIGIQSLARWMSHLATEKLGSRPLGRFVRAALVLMCLTSPVLASASVMPNYRLYTNVIGGGWAKAGYYFPHDEFYDSSVRDASVDVARRARPGARVASETPGLFEYYLKLAGRNDLISLSLTDHPAMQQMAAGDFVVVARGRRYLSNEALTTAVQQTGNPFVTITVGKVPSMTIFELTDDSSRALVQAATR